MLTCKKFLVGCAVLPTQKLLAAFKSFSGLLDICAHDFKTLFRLFLNHLEGFKIAVGQCLCGFWVVAQKLGGAAYGVHDHRVVQRGRHDLASLRLGAYRTQKWLVGHGGIQVGNACNDGIRCSLRLQANQLDVFDAHAIFLEHPGQGEVGRCAGCADSDCFAFQVAHLGDAGFNHDAVRSKAFVKLKNLRGRYAVGVPGDPCFNRGGGALHVTRGNRQMAVFLRNLFDRHIQPVFLENSCFFGQRQRRETSPAGHGKSQFGFLRVSGGACNSNEGNSEHFFHGFLRWVKRGRRG